MLVYRVDQIKIFAVHAGIINDAFTLYACQGVTPNLMFTSLTSIAFLLKLFTKVHLSAERDYA